MFRFSVLLRILGRAALVVYFLAAALFLGVRYWVLPNIDQWRPAIAQQLSSALRTRLRLDRVSAEWSGLNPRLELRGVDFIDEEGRRVLRLPVIRAQVGLRSLLSGVPDFLDIEASGLRLDVRRDAQGRLWLLGRSFDVGAPGDSPEVGLDQPLIQWLGRQRRLSLRDAVVRWRDDTRSGEPLVLDGVNLYFASDAHGHSLSMTAAPPPGLGKSFDLRARFDLSDPRRPRTDPLAWRGAFYVQVDGMAPDRWRAWLDVPGSLEAGHVSARWWLTFAGKELRRFASEMSVEKGEWRLGDGAVVGAGTARVFLDGPWNDYRSLFDAFEALTLDDAPAPVHVPADAEGVRFEARATGFALRAPGVFDHAIRFSRMDLAGRLRRAADGPVAATLEQARLVNDDMDLALRGAWRQGGRGRAGIADLTGLFRRASLDAIDDYMPVTVNPEARQWLAHGLLDGQLENATVVLRGDLADFPFGAAQGEFRVDGGYRDGVIDYLPARRQRPGWPRLTAMKGRASLHNVDLRVVADEATVWPAPRQPIQLRGVRARIPDIEHGAVLSIQGDTEGQAGAYLALARHSPLGGLLHGLLDEARADGRWQVPLRMTIPLLDADETRVRGAIRFDGGMAALDPQAPPFTQLRGSLAFSEKGLAAQDLKAQFLGGAAAFDGELGGAGQGLALRGKMDADALTQFVGVRGMKRLQGELAYKAVLKRLDSGRYALVADSDLRGLAVDAPAPLGKQAAQALPLRLAWQPASSQQGHMALLLALGAWGAATLLHRPGADGGPYFQAVAVSVGQPLAAPSDGLHVDARLRAADLAQWNSLVESFSLPLQEDQPHPPRQLFPRLAQLRVQADRMRAFGLDLDQATLTARREQDLRWRMDLASTQTAGTLFWREASGRVAGQVDAKFERLALGAADEAPGDGNGGRVGDDSPAQDDGGAQAQDDGELDDRLDIPAINLEVDRLALYGRAAGKLSVQGVNQQRGQLWRLDKLSLSGAGAELTGSGMWRLKGPRRGLTLDAQARFSDAGRYLEQLGFANVLSGGRGTLKGKVEWRNMPWKFQRSDLDGELRLELESGRFSTVNSRSARLLELLSLQSLRRLATLNLNPATAFKEGFPFDRLAGTLHVRQGIMSTNDYQVTGPVANISIGGDVDLIQEKLALQAMVVPNLDVSGASIAAGIAINPVVGVGAFLTQWLLRAPLSKAMTAHYSVSGHWDDPKLSDASDAPPSAPSVDDTDAGQLRLDDSRGLGETGAMAPSTP